MLVKPQFEAGREHVGKGGIVREQAGREIAIERVKACVAELGGTGVEVIESPITGMEGNRGVSAACAVRRNRGLTPIYTDKHRSKASRIES